MDRTTYEKKLLHSIITSIENNGGRELLSSVILTGSFGRDEPTYATNPDGTFHLKSDIEIALIFSKRKDKKAVNELIGRVSKSFAEDLNLMPISERRIRRAHNFNYSLCSSKRKTIFTFDLYNGSKTIWGRDYLQDVSVPLEKVDIYEAKRLVANRIGELCYTEAASALSDEEYFATQWKGKLMLALGSAWLILKKAYVSSYCGQLEKLREYRQDVNKDIGPDFIDQYEKVFRFLRRSQQIYEVPDDCLRSYVKNMDDLMKLHRITHAKVNSCSRMLKYLAKYVKTGMHYGLVNFENKILQKLITDYHQKGSEIFNTAKVWHKVLY